MTKRGFTLLEVMVAVSILGLGLTLILSSQAGLFASTKRIEDETVAATLVRCKMSELEVDLETKGFQLLDQHETGDCCEDEEFDGYTCDWKVETIELPLPTDVLNPDGDAEDGEEKDGTGGGAAKSKTDETSEPLSDSTDTKDSKAKATSPADAAASSGLGSMAIMAGLKGSDKLIAPGSGPEGLATALGNNSSGGPQGLVSMAMNLVYPTLKPMLEASIRKVTVAVLWKDGSKTRDLTVTQYITNPLEGSLSPTAALGLDDPALQGLVNGATGAGKGTSGTTTSGSNSSSSQGTK